MFTEGLDPHALRWVQQDTRSNSAPSKSGIRSTVLPRPEKFRSGNLNQSYVPVSRTIPATIDSVSSSSDMEVDSEYEDDRLNQIYYCPSPPKSNPIQTQRHQWAQRCSNDKISELSSSRHQHYSQKQKRDADSGEDTGEESECGGSFEFNSRFQRHNQDRYTPSRKIHSHSGSFQGDVGDFSEKGPSAPPLHEPARPIKAEIDREASKPRNGQKLSGSSTRNQQSADSKTRANASTSKSDTDAEATTSGSTAVRMPNFHASEQGPWFSVIAYDACVRLCLHSWAIGCVEAPHFLDKECDTLRTAFGLQQILLQSEEEQLKQRSSKLASEVPVVKPRKTMGRMKVQIRRVRMVTDRPPGCSFSSLHPSLENLKSFRHQISNFQSTLSSGWGSLRSIRLVPQLPASRSFSKNSLAYMQASTQYIKQVSALLKVGVTTLRSRSSYDAMQETYSCHLRLKSSVEKDFIRMQPGSSESHVFFPDSLGDDLIIEIFDSKGNSCGRVLVQVAAISESTSDKVRWWPIYHEPEHELVGHVQLFVSYSTGFDENSSLKCGSVAETMAYDVVLEVAMKAERFQQRNLVLNGPWQWLLTEFSSYYGVSDAYTKLRYLSYVMDVATPTADCLNLVYDLLSPVVMGNKVRCTLSHQENRILGEIEEQVEQILSIVFENYKSLDESSPSGIIDVFRLASGSPAPVLLPAVKLFTLLHDILSPESQLKLCGYFQTAVKKRSRRHLLETEEFINGNSEGCFMDVLSFSAAYQKMKTLCLNIRNEVFTDIEIHNHHVLPSFVDLPNISASIYSVELCNRLRAFLVACPPAGPAPPVADLVIATVDFQRDLIQWNMSAVKGGVDAKELFHLYIVLWIQDKRLQLLESCKLDKVKWSGVKTQHATTPFVDEMYDRLREMLNEYEVIICRWPEYTFLLENAVADVEKAVIEALEKQYAEALAPLKDALTPKKFGLKYVQKLAKRGSPLPYTIPEELGIVLNTMKRLLDVLRPRVEVQLKSWGACIPDGGGATPGERLSEVTVLLRAKFRNYLQALVDKLANNSREHNLTKMKKIIQDSKDMSMEADIKSRMQPLKEQLASTINQMHSLMQPHVFLAVCRGLWDRMGQDVLNFLENRKENRSWYKGARVAVAMLDDTFGSQMQQLLGNALLDKDLEPPRCIVEVRSVLCRDAPNHKESNFYF